MNILLTSCGLETVTIERAFMNMLTIEPSKVKAMFIPVAAISPDAIEVLPKCLNDLLRCGIRRENIIVNDLHDCIGDDLNEQFHVIYLCGGDSAYLLSRINEQGFNKKLTAFIDHGGIVVGVSAGSVIFANNIPGNLGLLQCNLDVHCSEDSSEKPGYYPKNRRECIKLGNCQAIMFENDNLLIID